ncbi:hypothetical protein COMA1_40315 [Candidatus Nitrospira nitrosa]|uniref:Uncharacterized protein n=1 Tax=Candidatus Nitrospira nitrosa TaxID=1742972 RepID=A0A0S4LKW4_9BACT|nr:hypothetical protein [Candidatus Nitrospira nitrosa]CUS37903.1 hypothetical protein COMA1_40315 [Candidatus Nitrospira nitrosa]
MSQTLHPNSSDFVGATEQEGPRDLMRTVYAEEWFGWAQRFYDLAVTDEERRWMYSILCQFCWEIAHTSYAEEFQPREHRLAKVLRPQWCVLLSKRDGSAPMKWVQVSTGDNGERPWLAYSEFDPTILGAREFMLVDPVNMIPQFTKFTSLVDWSGVGVEECPPELHEPCQPH